MEAWLAAVVSDASRILARVLPSLVSFLLTLTRFDRSVIVLGIQSVCRLCPNFHEQNRRFFPCLGPGTVALSESLSTISLGTSLIITALLEKTWSLVLSVAGGIVIILTFGNIMNYRRSIFTFEVRFAEAHPSLAGVFPILVSVLTLFATLTLALLSVISSIK